MRTGDVVTVLVHVFTEPPIERYDRCKVLGTSGDFQSVFIEGPRKQVARVDRRDVLPVGL